MTHCTESCGFSCTDLHDLAMGVVLKAEKQLREKQETARKEACPKYNDITNKYAAYADKYGKMATENVQACPKYNDITNKYAAYADKYGKMATENVQACPKYNDITNKYAAYADKY